MTLNLHRTVKYIVSDYKKWPTRFCLEIFAWALSMTCSVTMALTVPNPPFIPLYFAFLTQCIIFCWSAWTRGSFGMMANYTLLSMIDGTALIRLLIYKG
jgi:hypothetical protein